MQINGRGQPCFIIAEAGVNHNGQADLALQLVDAATEAGADAVKFQTFRAETLVTADAPQAAYQSRNLGVVETQFEMLKRLEISPEIHRALLAHCQNILFMSSPFDERSADLLAELGVAVFKLGSGELTNLPLLRHVAGFGKPMIVSTGMATLGEVENALNAIYQAGHTEVILLHCVSNYPAAPADVNLRAMHTLQTAFQVPVGYSDHTMGNEIALAAVALGACVIEKHLTLDRSMVGPDHAASAEPPELKALVAGIRRIEAALGTGIKQPTPSELETAKVARKSLVAACEIPAATILTEDMISLKRPSTGLPPLMLPYVIGRTARQDIPTGTLLSWDLLA